MCTVEVMTLYKVSCFCIFADISLSLHAVQFVCSGMFVVVLPSITSLSCLHLWNTSIAEQSEPHLGCHIRCVAVFVQLKIVDFTVSRISGAEVHMTAQAVYAHYCNSHLENVMPVLCR